MVLAANDVGDLQVDVVRTGSHVVSRYSVAAKQGEIFYVSRLLGLGAEDMVLKRYRGILSARHAEPQHERLPGRGAAVTLFGGQLTHSGIEQPGSVIALFLF